MELTLTDLRDLVDRFVPRGSIHPRYASSIPWWPSHELGHLLLAAPLEIGMSYYGLEAGSSASEAFGTGHEDYAYCCEHAAMYLSARLLRMIGLSEAARDERSCLRSSSPMAAAWLALPGSREKVHALIARRRCRTLPRTRATLEPRLLAAATLL